MKNFEQGVAYFKVGKFEEALGIINNCLVDQPGNAEFYSFRARVLSRMGKFEASLEDFDFLVKSEPYNTNYISDRAVVLHLLNKHQEALSELDRALLLDPNNPYRYSSRAYLKDRIGDLEGAIADYEKAIEIDPEDAVAYNNKGLVEEKLGYQDQSRQSFQNADSLLGYQSPKNDTLKEFPLDKGFTGQNQIWGQDDKNKPIPLKVSVNSFFDTLSKVISDKTTRKEFIYFIMSKFKNKVS